MLNHCHGNVLECQGVTESIMPWLLYCRQPVLPNALFLFDNPKSPASLVQAQERLLKRSLDSELALHQACTLFHQSQGRLHDHEEATKVEVGIAPFPMVLDSLKCRLHNGALHLCKYCPYAFFRLFRQLYKAHQIPDVVSKPGPNKVRGSVWTLESAISSCRTEAGGPVSISPHLCFAGCAYPC